MEVKRNSILGKQRQTKSKASLSLQVTPRSKKLRDRKEQIWDENTDTWCTVEVRRFENKNSIAVIKVLKNSPLRTVKEVLCRKLGVDKKSVYFCSEDGDYNFDYRIQENLGTLTEDKRLIFYFRSTGEKERTPDNERRRNLNDFFIYDCLSVGGFSQVFLVRCKDTGKFFVAKMVLKRRDDPEKLQELIYNEKSINEMLDHPMLVKMHTFFETEFFYVFILDYCPSGQLFCLMKAHRDMTEVQARFYFIETLLGIQYMHGKGIVYRDIKPENILIDQHGHIKIADFGLTRVMREKSTSYCGSLEYMAPQIVKGDPHWFDVDHYCLGSLLYEMMIGCPPFYNPEFAPSQTKYHIVNSPVTFPDDKRLSRSFKDLVTRLLEKDPEHRLGSSRGIKEIMQHPWIGEFDPEEYVRHQVRPPFKFSLQKSNFDTTYLPKEEIQQTLRLIELEKRQFFNMYKINRSISKKERDSENARRRFKSTETNPFKHANFRKNKDFLSPYAKSLNSSPEKLLRNNSSLEKSNISHSQSFNTFSIFKSFMESKGRNQIKASLVHQYSYPSHEENPSVLPKEKKVNHSNIQSCEDIRKVVRGTHLQKKSHNVEKENSLKNKFMLKKREIREKIEAEEAKSTFFSDKDWRDNGRGLNSKLNRFMASVRVD